MKEEGKIDRSRRQFIWQLAGVTGLTGLGRLAKAMAHVIQPLAIPRNPWCVDPGLPITCNHPADYDCVAPGHDCIDDAGFICTIDFDCGSWLNDFLCEDKFHCTGGFDCQGGGPGPEFICQGLSGQPDGYFICDPYGQFNCSDFYCPQEFTCPNNYNCGDAFSDYVCQAQFTCNDFNCEAVAEPGASFYCQNGFSCTNFQCDPGDFYCGPNGNMIGYTCFPPPQGYGYTCNGYQCGDAFSDYICQAQFTCQLFNCEAMVEPGASFYCENGFNCASQTTSQPFWCDPGDFYCGPNNNYVGYQCNGSPGGNYSMPKNPVVPIEIAL